MIANCIQENGMPFLKFKAKATTRGWGWYGMILPGLLPLAPWTLFAINFQKNRGKIEVKMIATPSSIQTCSQRLDR